VRFADEVATLVDTSSEGDEHRRKLRATAAASGRLVRPALRKAAYSSTREDGNGAGLEGYTKTRSMSISISLTVPHP
jgi:hypothetical protein